MIILSSAVRKTDRNLAVVIPTCGTRDISALVRTMDKSLREHRINPHFVLARGKESNAALLNVMEAAPSVRILDRTGRQGEVIMHAFDRWHKKSDALVFCCDDYNFLADDLYRLVEKLGSKSSAAIGNWDREAALYLPHVLFVAETAIAYAISSAGEKYEARVVPSLERKMAEEFEQKASNAGTLYKVYLGVMGFSSQAWPAIGEYAKGTFTKSQRSLEGVGIESALLLSAIHQDLRISQVELTRRYEHPILPRGSKQEEEYVRGRVTLLGQHFRVIAEYAAKSGQEEKLPALRAFRRQARAAMKKAGFHWPERDVLESEFNGKYSSSYMQD